MKKRLLASLLSATILLSMTPMAFADEEPVGENLIEPVQAETVEEAVPQAEPQEENNAPVVQEDPKAEETPADIVIDSDTTWSEARTLTGDLTVNSGATLTIGAQVTVSGDVTISGGGTMGMIMTQLALHSGGTNITVIEPIAMKREMAKKLGAVHTIDPVNQDRKEEAMKITDGRGFDVVIEASGSWRACDGIEELVGKGGTLEFFAALYRHDYDYKLNLLNAFFKEIRIVGGVFQSPYAFPRSIALVNTLDLDPILEMDCVFTPEAFEDAFEAQMNGRTIKSLVQFTPDVE